MIEPAPTDLFFVLALGAFALAPIRPVRLLGPLATGGILIYVWFTFVSLSFVEVSLPVAVRAVGIEMYLILLFLLTAYFAHQGGDRVFRIVLLMLTVGGAIASIIAFLAYLDMVPNRLSFYRDEHFTRVKSTFKDPNVLGPYLIPSILLMMWIALSVRRFSWLATSVFVLLTACLIITFSRGAWVHMALTTGIFAAFLLFDRRSSMATVMVLLLGILAATVKLGFFGDAAGSLASQNYLGSRLSFQSYDSDRFQHILTSLGNMFDRPLGIGPNQSSFVYGYQAHNTFVVLGLQNGVFAAIGFALFYLATMYRCLKKVLEKRDGWLKYAYILSVMIGLLVLMNVVGALHWRHLYVVLGLAYGSYRSNAIFSEEKLGTRT